MRRLAVGVVATAAALSLAAPSMSAGAAGAAGAGPGGPRAGDSFAAPQTPARSEVTLITGERVQVTAGPRGPQVAITPVATTGPSSVVQTMHVGNRSYVVPAVARPYLGRQLDPSLFEVTAAATGGEKIPVSVSYSGAARPSVAGLTLTAASAGHATGYFTPTSAKTFGAALADQVIRDSQSGSPVGSALFGHVTSIAAAHSTPVVQPSYPMVTLILKAVGTDGKPLANAFGIIVNSDDARKYGGFFSIFDGQARVSVPRGHYAAISSADSFAHGVFSSNLMLETDVAVTRAGQTLTLDARKATTAAPSVVMPRPAVVQELGVTIEGSDETGIGGFGFGVDATPSRSILHLPPMRQPTYGSITEKTVLNAQDGATPGGTYRYDGGWVDAGIPTDQRHQVPSRAGSALTRTTYYSDRPSRIGGSGRLVVLPGTFFVFGVIYPTPMPLQRDEYAFGPPGTSTLDIAMADPSNFNDPGEVDGGGPVVAGTTQSTSFLRSPFTLNLTDPVPGASFALCLACRTATNLTLAFGLLDGVATHSGPVFASSNGTTVATFRLTRDGHVIVNSQASLGGAFDVPAATGTFRAVSTVDRFLTGSVLSTSTQTDVTFVSAAGMGPVMPAGWFCPSGQSCRVLPILRGLIDVHGTLTGTVPLGTTVFDLQVDHNAGSRQPAVTSVSVEVRRSGTTAWRSLPVTDFGHGRYAVVHTAAAGQGGQLMDLRVNATDVAGGILHQTTTRAFRIGS
ncbi:MAG: hypothetical protein ABI083_07155 [Lapillicoccus sp.]